MKKMVLFNSLGRELEEFKPIHDGVVKMYCCGPTVYAYAHIGNLRTYLFEDILRRTLEYNGYEVKHVMNITDVGHLTSNEDFGEDKVEKSAKTAGMTAWELVKFYTDAFLVDLNKLNIKKPDLLPRATDHIPEQIKLVQDLEKAGYCYITSDGVYFDVTKWKTYGQLSGQKLEDKMAGARVEMNEEKKHPSDFAVWKFSPEGQTRQMEWDTPWGRKGFPGWHIECSAMSMKYLGHHFDIHCGGVDHIPVHHENEIAQSEAATHQKYVNYWVHGEFMMVDGRRMGKSEGNAFQIKDLIEKGMDPMAYRYLNLGTHYRIQLNFTWEGLQAAETALNRLRGQVMSLKEKFGKVDPNKVLELEKAKFWEAINNDLNTAEALSILWEVVKSGASDEEKLATIENFDQVLGLKLTEKVEKNLEVPDEVQKLLDERQKARSDKNFSESDRLREEVRKLGFEVKDTAKGQELEKA